MMSLCSSSLFQLCFLASIPANDCLPDAAKNRAGKTEPEKRGNAGAKTGGAPPQ
jgi:hypothetical protein